MARQLVALAVLCTAALGPALVAGHGSGSDQQSQDHKDKFCKIYQWVCKATCGGQSCCHLPASGPLTFGAPKCFCTQKDADRSSQDVIYCCGGDGPIADPIFKDLQNRTFEFFGQPGATYNVLTHKDAIVNMRLAWAGERHVRSQTGEGTFAEVLAFAMPGDSRIMVEVSTQGEMAVTIDNEDIDMDQQFAMNLGKTNVTFNPYREEVGEQITISSDLFTFVVTAVKAFEDEVTGYNRGHLDLSTEIKSPPGALEGVLGASLYVTPEDLLREPEDNSFYDEGKEAAYLMKELFEGMQMRQTSASRRRLIEGSRPGQLTFPIRASLSSSL